MDITAYLIERELLARRAVALPFIGTLSYQRLSSRFAFDRSHLIPPQNTICLAPNAEQEGDEFIELIAAEIGVTPSEAIQTYNDWYASSTDATGAILTIESICSIDLISYTLISIDEQFAQHLTPLGSEPMAIGRPLDSRGIEATTFQPQCEMPRSQILETLPILEDLPSVPEARPQPMPAQQMQQPPMQPQPHAQATPNRSVRQVSQANHHTAPRKRQSTRAHHQTGASTTALTASIAIATIGVLYIAYYILTEYGILDRL